MNLLNLKQQAQGVLVFTKWGRKSYSMFQTIHRIVQISVLTVIYLLFSPVVSLAIERDTSEIKIQYDLDEIEVSAQRSPALYSQVARIISVIERKEIESAPVQNVTDLLEYVAGIDVRQRGNEGVQADVSIRGGNFDQTLILLNGINITDPQTGHHNFNLPVSLNQIERIEVLEGPAARVYGPNAFSGAINVVTKNPESKEINLSTSYGKFNFFNASADGTFKTGKLNHLLALNQKSSDGYIENTDFKIANLFYTNKLVSEKGNLYFQIGATVKGFGANSFYTPKYPNQYEKTKTLISSVKWESLSKFHFTPVIYWRRHQDRFELFRENPASWYKSHNYHLTDVYGANLNSWIQSELGKTAFGLEFRSENILSNVLGEQLESPKNVPGESAVFTKSKSRQTVSGFLEHSMFINKWSLTGGILANGISESNSGLNIFPGLDAGYKFSESLKMFASYNTSLRMPTFTDLYYSGPTNIGNPDLKPEKSSTLEGGLKLNGDFIQGHFVVFYRQGKDIIDWVKNSNEDLWQPMNLTRLNNVGAEIKVEFNLQEKFGKSFPQKIQFSYLNNKVKKQDLEIISNYVLDNLKHKLTGSIIQPLSKSFAINLNFNYQDREGTYTSFENGNYANEVNYSPFCLFDGKLNYTRNNLVIFISANNIFDVQYVDIGNVMQPGRWIKTGISMKIKYN